MCSAIKPHPCPCCLILCGPHAGPPGHSYGCLGILQCWELNPGPSTHKAHVLTLPCIFQAPLASSFSIFCTFHWTPADSAGEDIHCHGGKFLIVVKVLSFGLCFGNSILTAYSPFWFVFLWGLGQSWEQVKAPTWSLVTDEWVTDLLASPATIYHSDLTCL